MLGAFSRTELLFGKEAMEALARSRVAVFGIGGVGGYVREALWSLGRHAPLRRAPAGRAKRRALQGCEIQHDL